MVSTTEVKAADSVGSVGLGWVGFWMVCQKALL